MCFLNKFKIMCMAIRKFTLRLIQNVTNAKKEINITQEAKPVDEYVFSYNEEEELKKETFQTTKKAFNITSTFRNTRHPWKIERAIYYNPDLTDIKKLTTNITGDMLEITIINNYTIYDKVFAIDLVQENSNKKIRITGDIKGIGKQKDPKITERYFHVEPSILDLSRKRIDTARFKIYSAINNDFIYPSFPVLSDLSNLNYVITRNNTQSQTDKYGFMYMEYSIELKVNKNGLESYVFNVYQDMPNRFTGPNWYRTITLKLKKMQPPTPTNPNKYKLEGVINQIPFYRSLGNNYRINKFLNLNNDEIVLDYDKACNGITLYSFEGRNESIEVDTIYAKASYYKLMTGSNNLINSQIITEEFDCKVLSRSVVFPHMFTSNNNIKVMIIQDIEFWTLNDNGEKIPLEIFVKQ